MRSFTGRIVIQFAVLITVTIGVVLAAGGWFLSREALNGLDLLNEAEFTEIQDRLGPDPIPATEVDRRIRSHTEIDSALYFFQVLDAEGRIVFRSANLGAAELPHLPHGQARGVASLPGVGAVRLGNFPDGPFLVQVASPLQPERWLLKDYARISVYLLAGVGLASVGLGWAFARLTLRPIRNIHTTASRIRAETLTERIPMPGGRDEMADMVSLLNRMFDRLEASFEQIRRFTADASHELRTPLTLVRLNVEKLQRRHANDPEATALVQDLLEELDNIGQITDSLLFLAKAESGALVVNKSDVLAEDFVRAFAEDAVALAEDRRIRFLVARSDCGRVRCDPTLLRQLLINLTTNALRVSKPGGAVSLQSELSEGRWRLLVSDEGPGLPPEMLDRVFERFLRYGPTSGTAGPEAGAGLGLAICRGIAFLHGGTVRAANRPAGGLQVLVDLPTG